MASSKKAIVERLEEIRAQASQLAIANDGAQNPTGVNAANLAEEAANLGLELAAKGKGT